MSKATQRIISLLLVSVMACSLFACAKDDGKTDAPKTDTTATDTAAETTAETELTRANYPDTLEDGLNFDGADYRVLCRHEDPSFQGNEIVTDNSEIGEIVNDTIYRKNEKVASRLNVNISKVTEANSAFNNMVKKTITTDDDVFDIIAGYAYYITPLALDNLFINLVELPHINFDMPWWPKSIMDKLVIHDVLYFMTGDYAPSLVSETFCVFFNKTVAENRNVPDLYEMLFDGKWTLENYCNIINGVTEDLNGDSKYDINDLYGIASLSFNAFLVSTELELTEFDENGDLTLTLYNEKFVDVYNRVYSLMHNNNAVFSMKSLLADRPQEVTLFVEDRCLFYPERFLTTTKFRNMTSDFGFLPYPKYDEEQEEYHTISHDNYSLLCVPTTAKDLNMIGAVTEAMAAESYRTVTPAYLDTALKEKYSRDEESKLVCDMLIAGTVFEPILIYSNSLADSGLILYNIFQDKEDIASLWQSKLKGYEKAFDKFNEKYADAAIGGNE